jgi:predicted small secreted protein
MFRRVIILLCLAVFLSAGCSTVGEVTGKTVKGVENAAGDFKQGYRKGKAQ